MKRLPRNITADDTGRVTHASCTNPECGCGDALQEADAFATAPNTKVGLDNQCKACRARTSQQRYNEKRDATHGTDRVRHRPRSQLAAIDMAIARFAEEYAPVSCRQIYYGLVTQGLIKKSEDAYKRDICHRSAMMRADGRMPHDWIVDHTRKIRLPYMCADISDSLLDTAASYRRDMWEDQADYIQVWLEKDALLEVFYPVTSEYGVPLLIARGYSSVTFINEAANAIKSRGKPTHVYYFGDHDPSGDGARDDVRRKLEGHGCKFASFTVAAVTPALIESLNLPTRPTKESDTRSAKFIDKYPSSPDSVELDAIRPDMLRQMVRGCIEPHIDREAWDATLEIEESERQTLSSLAERVEENGLESLDEYLVS